MIEEGCSINEVRVGEEVLVYDLSSYTNSPDVPCKGIIKRIDPYPYIVVEINNKDWEVYEFGFSKIK